MPLLRLVFGLLIALAPVAAQASDVKIKVSISLHGWWWPFGPRYALPVSPHHISAAPAAPAPAKDSCTFVAGVRHCPRAEPR